MGLEKIADAPARCLNPSHNFPAHIKLDPGTYRYTCPGCGQQSTVTVPQITC